MAFEALLGNDRLKDNLTKSLAQGRVSHFYLISGPQGSGKRTLSRLLSAAILCKEKEKPCLRCSACRKVMENSHPDVISVTDPEHKNVAVKIVRQAREDVYVRPNEGEYKIYIFPQELGIEGQNALLKILEEPPAYGVFLLLTNNPEQMLPTVRSRCTELSLQALPEELLKMALTAEFPNEAPDAVAAAIARSGGYLGQAKALLEQGDVRIPQTEQFLTAYARKDSLELTKTLATMEKWRREQLLPVLEDWTAVLEEALAFRSGVKALHPMAKEISAQRSPRELMHAVTQLQKAIAYAQSNVAVGAICGYLAWELR